MLIILSLAIAGKIAGTLLSRQGYFQAPWDHAPYARDIGFRSSEPASVLTVANKIDFDHNGAIA
jgi:hypothetical protein